MTSGLIKSRVKETYILKNSLDGVAEGPVDSVLFEKRWQNEKEIILPFDPNVRALNTKELIFLLMKIIGISKYLKSGALKSFFYSNVIKMSIKRIVSYIRWSG